jgi:hypothetical protein
MIVGVTGKVKKGTCCFGEHDLERKAVKALTEFAREIDCHVEQLSNVVVPTLRLSKGDKHIIVEIYRTLKRGQFGRLENRFFVVMSDEVNDGHNELIEVKGASQVVPTATKVIKRILS